MSKKQFFLQIQGEQIPYEVEKKTVKRMTLRVRRDGTVHVTAPQSHTYEQAKRFVLQYADWIAEKRNEARQRQEKKRTPRHGDVLHLQGQPHTLLLKKGNRTAVVRGDGFLSVTLQNTEDAAALIRALRRFIKSEATRVFTERAREIYRDFSPHPPTFPTLSFRFMRSRWGSCTASKNRMTLSEKLLLVPPHLSDYVIYHEFCHFKHQNHSAAFWAHLAKFVPDYKERRRALNAVPMPELELK